jgi:hypothetical protein
MGSRIRIERSARWCSWYLLTPSYTDSVSLKDTVNVKGYDACIGYSAWCKKPAAQDGGLIRCLKDTGAIPFVKTNVPTSLLSFESYNDVWGRTTNPHNKDYSPGGSSGGESALLAAGGSIIGVGIISDSRDIDVRYGCSRFSKSTRSLLWNLYY